MKCVGCGRDLPANVLSANGKCTTCRKADEPNELPDRGKGRNPGPNRPGRGPNERGGS